MWHTHFLGKIRKQFWDVMDDHIGAEVVFRFFFPLIKRHAKIIMDAWVMVDYLVVNARINEDTRQRLTELRTFLQLGLPDNPKAKPPKWLHGYPKNIFDYELDEFTHD